MLFVSLRAQGGGCTSAFSGHNNFLYFVRARFVQTPSLFFCEYHERKNPLNAKTFSYMEA